MYAEKKLDVLMASLVPFCILNSDNWHVKGAGILCHGCIQYLSHMGSVRGELYATTVRQDNKFCERVLSGSYSSDRIFCMAIWVLWLGEHLVFEYRHQTHFWEVSFTQKKKKEGKKKAASFLNWFSGH